MKRMAPLLASVGVWVTRQRRGTAVAVIASVVVALSVVVAPAANAAPGDKWTSQKSPTDERMDAVTYGNGLFVAVGSGVMTSPDGKVWTSRASVALTGGWESVTYGNGMFVALRSAYDSPQQQRGHDQPRRHHMDQPKDSR